MKNFLWLLLALASITTSCNRSPKPVDPASAQAVKVQIDILRDTVQARWTEMQTSDDAKLRDLRQLLSLLESQPGIDRAQLKDLQRTQDQLKHLRYTQETMAESARIDAYDTAQDSLLRVVYRLALPTDREPAPAVKTLTDQIQDADTNLIGYRVRYDQAATRFNNYLQVHAAELTQLGGSYARFRPLPLFTLPN